MVIIKTSSKVKSNRGQSSHMSSTSTIIAFPDLDPMLMTRTARHELSPGKPIHSFFIRVVLVG
jgi:hypothetical protein